MNLFTFLFRKPNVPSLAEHKPFCEQPIHRHIARVVDACAACPRHLSGSYPGNGFRDDPRGLRCPSPLNQGEVYGRFLQSD